MRGNELREVLLTKSQSKEEPDDAKVSSPVLKTCTGGASCAEFNWWQV
jgi:hypothetical protein